MSSSKVSSRPRRRPSSISWHSDASPKARLLVLPPAAASLDEAHAAIELWEHYKRRTLDPTQRLVVEVMMATTKAGMWAAPTTGREMPRQNGKGDEVEVVELWGLLQRAERILHTIHDAVLLATETQARMLSVIEGHPDLRRLMLRRWLGTGQQMIEMRNGGIIWYRTRTGSGARGIDEVDRVVVDEAQHAEDEHLSAITPTQAVSANPQLNAIGTSGIAGKSEWWWSMRLRALRADPGDFGYVGHTAEVVRLDEDGHPVQAPVDVTDRRLWWDVNPVLRRRPELEGWFAEQLDRLGPHLFGREHLGVWDPPVIGGGSWLVISAESWAFCRALGLGLGTPAHYSLDVDDNGRGEQWASIGVSDGSLVQLVETAHYGPGTGWVVDVLKARKDEVGDLLVAKDSPAWALVPALEQAGVKVQPVASAEFTSASMQFLDAVTERTLGHADQRALNAAVAGVVQRDVGDGQWRWSRSKSVADIGPLCAVSMARWAALGAKPLTFAY